MKQSHSWKAPTIAEVENQSVKQLMEKMGMSQKEIREIKNNYGVSAARLLELMQMSKYPFVYPGRVAGQCDPCRSLGNIRPKG